MIDKCPKCNNEKIIEKGGMEVCFERSVATGKLLKKEKKGSAIHWMYTCKCGWESETFTE